MADEITERPVAPAVSAPAEPSPGVDDLDALLSAYDQQVNDSQSRHTPSMPEPEAEPSSGEALQAPDVPRGSAGDQTQQQFRALIDSGAFDPRNVRLGELEKFAGEATAFIRAQQEAQWRAREQADAAEVVREFEQELSAFKLARVDARAWLLNEYALNGDLANAWNNRYAEDETDGTPSPTLLRARAEIERAKKRFRAHVEREDQRIAAIPYVEDREAVTQAVRGAVRGAPVEKPVNVAKLSDSDLKEQTKSRYGYVPNF